MTITLPKHKTASFDVDAQKGFTPICPDELPVDEGHLIGPQLNLNNDMARLRIGSKYAHPFDAVWNANGDDKPALTPMKESHRNVDIYWPSHCVSGTTGCELLNELPHPQDYDFFVWKGVEPDMHPYGACYHDLHDKMSTGVIEFLKAEKIENIVVGGLATDFCVFKTVMQLLNAGFNVYLMMDSCRGIDPEGVKDALNTMQKNGATLIDDRNTLKSE